MPEVRKFQPKLVTAPGRPQEAFPAPPAAKPSGLLAGMPLPTTKAVTPEFLTPLEQETLAGLGWKQGESVPSTLPDVLAATRASLDPTVLAPPVPLDTPPLVVPEAVDVNSLPAEKRQQITNFLEQSRQLHTQEVQQEAQRLNMAGPGVNEAISGRGQVNLDIEDDVDDTVPAPTNETGVGGLAPSHCPHCNFPLDQQDVPDPDPLDRQLYLQAVLGLKPFTKSYSLYDGSVQVQLRELKPAELEAVFRYAYARTKELEAAARPFAFNDLVERARLTLQLSQLTLGNDATAFPASLAEWKAELPATQSTDPAVETLNAAAEQIFANVITTESFSRALVFVLGNFCRLVAKLEVSADRPDFWTAAPTTS